MKTAREKAKTNQDKLPVEGDPLSKETLALLESVVSDMERRFETAVRPVRKGVLERFPVLFLLAVTVGVGAVSVGIERILLSYDLFADSPWTTLGLGFIILAVTGTVYKKLG